MRLRTAAFLGALAVLVSACGGSHSRPVPPPPSANAPGLGSLATSGAGHVFYEIYEPSGAPRGTMLMIHGGGWLDKRGDARRYMATVALAVRAAGWRVVNISYTPSPPRTGAAPDPRAMLDDVVAFYDQIRRAYGGPVCAYGQSAGGHLAAMLAVERPSLKCAILDAGPVDLVSARRTTDSYGRSLIRNAIGTSQSALDQWSPARDWKRGTDHTAVWATYADGDPLVPPQQGEVLKAADPSANVADIGSGAFYWLHSSVDYNALAARISSLFQWLDGLMPQPSSASAPVGADVGSDCDQLPAPGQRWQLLRAGDAWQENFPHGQALAATRGCSGSAHWQDDGLSLWALPSATGAVVPAGTHASLELDSGHSLSKLSVKFRGFFARPQDWDLVLYASTSTQGPITTPVAGCERGSCSGLGLFKTSFGSLITAGGSHTNPDQSEQPPSASFTLPAGTRRIAWALGCANPSGCSLRGIDSASGAAPRPRDPLGHPAIFSLYRVAVS